MEHSRAIPLDRPRLLSPHRARVQHWLKPQAWHFTQPSSNERTPSQLGHFSLYFDTLRGDVDGFAIGVVIGACVGIAACAYAAFCATCAAAAAPFLPT